MRRLRCARLGSVAVLSAGAKADRFSRSGASGFRCAHHGPGDRRVTGRRQPVCDRLVLAFAILSLLLASVGLYGVLSYLTTQRTTELGIRMALGAQRDQLLRLMLVDGLRPALFGLGLGLLGSVAATRIFQSMLLGTKPLDPVVLSGVIGTLLAVAMLACLAPAWRASRLESSQLNWSA